MRVLKISVLAALLVMAATVAFAGPTYDRVMSTKVVKAGMSNQGIPGGFINDKNEWVGFDVDMATEIAKRLGCTLEKVVVNNNTRVSFVQTDPPKVDMVLANMTHKRERDQKIDFSITYFFDGQKFLAKKGAVKDVKDLAGMKVGSMQGTTSIVNATEYLKKLGNPDPKVIGYDGEIAMFEALRSGRVQAISTDSTILLGYAAKVPGQFELVGDFISDEPYGIGLPQDDSAWRDIINFTIQDMWKDGTYMTIYNKWFGPDTDYPFPMTEKIELWP
ncbi:MAG: ABC transporter substrate-binding protein [Pseudodesulfovibrio sp.]|uniref:Extracellular solute-binding protein family 3 n=1 Tax=Pseudodesulfovibrio aespoeensis (strain ATCC 700646 / DSM 10631 / Aspo-2) TaxID=643562 RepID=E6VZT6_PSEA9|nr:MULTISPECIES: ABC transporter substrate-binding protein [Pseudodesulfovibrio]MBU4244888.1 ABC transporter substrate-binding protein [Pseudomonadota bacterium]ADU62914.1 extracellular solute-binding protein family 3 [Pseudodesulfovibrio aespoeensis Aspo-2]MBU4380552.1 ABC transporter substrate-binding protein [Pseudomonadota bacterium]MBU4474246.1 ABC transporter substrate-binding protein [Pseudomonadota bacterium]MBU4514636.1 ABC transporter substrate-binding protein [Pseudomonadota bacteri